MAQSKEIKSMEEFSQILNESQSKLVLLCKFSPICPTSSQAEREYRQFLDHAPDNVSFYHINVVYSRSTARGLAKEINVRHESPQALLFKDSNCIWNASHYELTEDTFAKVTSNFDQAI